MSTLFSNVFEGEQPGKANLKGKVDKNGKITYNFPPTHDEKEDRKKERTGYAQIEGVKSFSCANCSWFSYGNYCQKWRYWVEPTGCCSGWESSSLEQRKQNREAVAERKARKLLQ